MKNKLFIFLLVFTTSAFATLKVDKPKVIFEAIGKPSFIKAKGFVPIKDLKLSLNNKKLSVVAIVLLDKLNSGIELRDEHLKNKYLEIKKYPQARLVISEKLIKFNSNSKIMGTLELHGKTKEIELKVEHSKTENSPKLSFFFDFKLSDFEIDLPSFKGITAADTIKLNVETELVNEKL